jgi:hypothetical protein
MPFTQKSGSTLSHTRVNSTYLNPGLQLIGFESFAGVATAQITNFIPTVTNPFSSANLNYRLVIQEVTSVAASTLFLKMRLSGTDTIAASYYYGGLSHTDAGVVTQRTAFGTANGMRIGTTNTSASGFTVCATIDIISPFASGSTCLMVEAREASGTFSGGGTYLPATSYNQLSLVCASNITGKMMLYAWRNP